MKTTEAQSTALLSLDLIVKRWKTLNDIQFLFDGDMAKKRGTLLLQAKPQLEHGKWTEWVKENCGITVAHASKLISVAQENVKGDPEITFYNKPTTIRDRAKASSEQRGKAQPRQAHVEAETSAIPAPSHLMSVHKVTALRELGIWIADIGVLCVTPESAKILLRYYIHKAHPDKGGTHERFILMQRVQQTLIEEGIIHED
jgi:hypothetical protein